MCGIIGAFVMGVIVGIFIPYTNGEAVFVGIDVNVFNRTR